MCYLVIDFVLNCYCSESSSGDSLNISVVEVTPAICSTGSDDSVANYSVSPGGMSYYIPSCVAAVATPVRNQVFDSLEKAYRFYNEYGKLGSFTRSMADYGIFCGIVIVH